MQEWMLHTIGLVAAFSIVRLTIAKADEMGHFQVHNEQEGDLKIHATKEIAQIETQANSVQVVLEPGKVNAPREETSDHKGKIKKIIHIVNPVYMGGLRRSKINSKIDRTERAAIEGEKTFENSIMLENWKKENGYLFKSNVGRRHSVGRRSVMNARRYKKETMRTKKTEIEKVTRVHGRTGGLHVTTGKHGTKLISKGGALNVFIRNDRENEEKEEEMDENSKRRSYPDETKYHVINANMNGLSLKRDITTKRGRKCLIPPCTP